VNVGNSNGNNTGMAALNAAGTGQGGNSGTMMGM